MMTFIYPNPFENNIYLSINTRKKSYLYVTVVDIRGKIVYNCNYKTKDGFNANTIELNGLESGIYYLKLENSDFNAKYMLVKH